MEYEMKVSSVLSFSENLAKHVIIKNFMRV